ncbi:hypothetical protein [Sphingomonas paeninsulae]|uniref:hypothetical protein n=1 Tax=Sphingomonas paeninsulae TaxID=2319844 RepID=UPI0013CE7323|nr:hypothetical protein [Sphingomonas paeninsulae]
MNQSTPQARVATRIAEAMAGGLILYVADDEREAEAMAAAVAAITRDPVIFIPSSDALPGDDTPASPANAGRRVAALRRLRLIIGNKEDTPLACVVAAEATARLYPGPADFNAAPPRLALGDEIDVAALSDQLFDIGYFVDDRIDEPGEIAVRGEVIDIFPADSDLPVRIEIADGRIATLRTYDPLSQRTIADVAFIEVGRAAEPLIGAGVSLLAHLKPATVVFASKVEARRTRFLALAAEAERLGRRGTAAVPQDRWDEALAESV